MTKVSGDVAQDIDHLPGVVRKEGFTAASLGQLLEAFRIGISVQRIGKSVSGATPVIIGYFDESLVGRLQAAMEAVK